MTENSGASRMTQVREQLETQSKIIEELHASLNNMVEAFNKHRDRINTISRNEPSIEAGNTSKDEQKSPELVELALEIKEKNQKLSLAVRRINQFSDSIYTLDSRIEL